MSKQSWTHSKKARLPLVKIQCHCGPSISAVLLLISLIHQCSWIFYSSEPIDYLWHPNWIAMSNSEYIETQWTQISSWMHFQQIDTLGCREIQWTKNHGYAFSVKWLLFCDELVLNIVQVCSEVSMVTRGKGLLTFLQSFSFKLHSAHIWAVWCCTCLYNPNPT